MAVKVEKVLVVDEDFNAELFWEMAVKDAFPSADVYFCKTGPEALEFVRDNPVSLFIASWDLRPMSGMAFMQRIQDLRRHRYTPFLIFSKALTSDDLDLVKDLGMTNYLLKPFSKDDVGQKLDEMIKTENTLTPAEKNIRQAEDLLAEKRINDVIRLISPYLKSGKFAQRAFCLHGEILLLQGKYEEAEKSLLTALGFDKEFLPAHSALGRLYLRQKKYDEASRSLEYAHSKSPRNINRILELGTAALEMGDSGKAEQMFRQASDLDDGNPGASAGMGHIALQADKLELAARLFKESGKADEIIATLNNMAVAIVNRGQTDEAIALYRKAITVLPDSDKVHLLHYNLGLAFYKAKDYGNATNAFTNSLLKQPAYEKARKAVVQSAALAKQSKQAFDGPATQRAIQMSDEVRNQGKLDTAV